MPENTSTARRAITLRLDPDIYDRLRHLADYEDRPVAVQAARLLVQQLDALDAEQDAEDAVHFTPEGIHTR
jgi:predicted transcriptional regulator